MQIIRKSFLAATCLMFSNTIFAAVSMTEISSNVFNFASNLSVLIYKLCYVIGIALLVGSMMQFKEHRDRPGQIHMSQPVAMLLLGLSLIALPILAGYSEAAKSFGT